MEKLSENLPSGLHQRFKTLINSTLDQKFLERIKEISNNYGLKFNINFEIIIVSSKEKYLFNYLSGAFGNKNPKEGVKNIYKFIKTSRFLRRLKYLSARAIYDKRVSDKVMVGLNYFIKHYGTTAEKDFVMPMKQLCKHVNEALKKDKGVILLGVPPGKEPKPSKRLLAHELFHLVLIKNGFWFQGIKSKYDYLDEELASLLACEFTENEELKMTNLWFKLLSPLKIEERFNKIKEIYKKLEDGFSGVII